MVSVNWPGSHSPSGSLNVEDRLHTNAGIITQTPAVKYDRTHVEGPLTHGRVPAKDRRSVDGV